MSDPRAVRVSVIVPVYNPGTAIEPLIASLDRQTLPSTQFELLLCDDGSDEATRAQLDAIARDRPYVRVENLPHSGWPGTPRNHGIATASGTYLAFVDQDDYLFDGALQHMCDYADRHSSDVVVGKEVGIGRPLPRQIFRRDIPRATLDADPILEMLTPHKMFRTAFLRANGIRFPEGRVRLEDHLFVMEAYFRARTISVLASEPYYAWVKQPGSASSSRIDPETYFPHLEAVLDLVEANTEPGPLRDRLLRHWFRGKVLKRLSGRQMSRYPDDYRVRLLDVVAPLAQRRFGSGVRARLAFPNRIRATLLQADRRDDLLRLAQYESSLECRAQVTAAAWSRGGGLRLTVRVRITDEGEDALVFTRGGTDPKGVVWSPPEWLRDLSETELDARRDVRGDRVELLVREAGTSAETLVAHRVARKLESVVLSVDPIKLFDRPGAPQRTRLTANVRRAGWSFETELLADPDVLRTAGPSPIFAGRTCVLATTEDGALELRRNGDGKWKDSAGRAMRRARVVAKRLKAAARRVRAKIS